MDQSQRDPSVADRDDSTVFSEAEYWADPARIVAHAAATGRAVVMGSNGRPRVIITIPTTDLPTLEY